MVEDVVIIVGVEVEEEVEGEVVEWAGTEDVGLVVAVVVVEEEDPMASRDNMALGDEDLLQIRFSTSSFYFITWLFL